jgi:CHAT domain-containing protein
MVLRREEIKLSIVAEPNAPKASALPEVMTEAGCITNVLAAMSTVIAPRSLLGSTTTSRAEEYIRGSHILHLACHGIQDSQDALQSGFLLGDARMTVSRIMDLNLDHAFLAFLSACETAKGDSEQPNQTIHLAAAMLFAGFSSVVATMW